MNEKEQERYSRNLSRTLTFAQVATLNKHEVSRRIDNPTSFGDLRLALTSCTSSVLAYYITAWKMGLLTTDELLRLKRRELGLE